MPSSSSKDFERASQILNRYAVSDWQRGCGEIQYRYVMIYKEKE